VRTELAHCLTEIGDEKAQATLAKLLNDGEKGLRLLAAKKLGQAGGSRAAALLSEHIRRDSFVKRDSDEKSELFDALGRTGSDEALPVLEKLIRKTSLFNWADNNEMKKCAIMAVGRLGSDRARDLLERMARHTRGGLRRACLDGLKLCSLNVSQGGGHE
jgi:HEAT repeat protein